MKKILVYIFPFLIVAFFAMMVTSCADHDFDWEEAYQNNPEYKYQQVFRSVFGDVSPDQSWDFSGFSGEIDPHTRATTDDKTSIGSKRYMVEDLSTDTSTSIDGYKSDIDFNDIVVDFYQYSDGSQKAIIRAMGGTLDFELYVGGTKVFQKSSNFDVKTMYNTGYGTDKGGDGSNIDSGRVLATINNISGWNPETNNIKFVLIPSLSDMTYNDSSQATDNPSRFNVYEISFPDDGTKAPRIIAVPTGTNWMPERTRINFLSTDPVPAFSITLNAEPNKGSAYIVNNTSGNGTVFYKPVAIQATANDGFRFDHWSDGNTDNPRYINYDAELYAYFSEAPSTEGGTLWEGTPVSANNWALFYYTGNGASYNRYPLNTIRVYYDCNPPQNQNGQIQMRIGESGNYIWQQYDLSAGTNLYHDIQLTDNQTKELKNSTFGKLFNIYGQYITINRIVALN